MLVLAVRHGPEVDSSYLEGLLIADVLRELEAFRPEDAVYAKDIGFTRIPGLRGRSDRQAERVAFTEDGRLYLKKGRLPVHKILENR